MAAVSGATISSADSALARFLEPAPDTGISFAGKFPADFLTSPRPDSLAAWHLVRLVPQGKARIRAQISAGHTKGDLAFAIEQFAEVKKELGIN